MNLDHNQARILLFARLPRLGQVKTRLQPAFSAEQALAIYRQLLHHSLRLLQQARLCPVELWLDSRPSRALAWQIQRRFAPIAIRVQQGEDLGQRMRHALHSAKREAAKVVLLGVDCPAIDRTYLATALAKVSADTPAVLGPATDGGYVLLATQAADLPVFDGIAWGSNQVMRQTRQRLRLHDINWFELPPLPDIDRPEDVAAARQYGIRVPLAAPR